VGVPIEESQVERLAQAIHERYLAEQTRHGVAMGASAAMTPWPSLDEDLKEANRDQARDIAVKLATIGCSVVPASTAADRFFFAADELDLLACHEHLRWNRQRTLAGWRHGPRRDDETKRHPSLVPWAELPESEKVKDREAVANIPTVLAAAGLRVVRRAGPARR
jgi:hypothetical protein